MKLKLVTSNNINNELNEKIKLLNVEYNHQMDKNNKNMNHKYETLTTSYKEKLGVMQDKYKIVLEKERKKSEAYKEKAIGAHNMNKMLSSNIETMQAMSEL